MVGGDKGEREHRDTEQRHSHQGFVPVYEQEGEAQKLKQQGIEPVRTEGYADAALQTMKPIIRPPSFPFPAFSCGIRTSGG